MTKYKVVSLDLNLIIHTRVKGQVSISSNVFDHVADVFEDTVDVLTENAPYNMLKAWIKEEDKDGTV